MTPQPFIRILWVAITALLMTGCAQFRGKTPVLALQFSYDQANHAAAAAHVELELNKSKQEPDVGLLMDLCAYFHYAGNYKRSNRACQMAAARADDLYTKSIREQATSYLTSDNAISFQGEEYERLFLHVIGMLNYAAMNEPQSALVESRRLDNKIKYFTTNPEATPSQFKGDALGRYISGLLYEQSHENNDAFIDFQKAIRTFEVNPGITVPNTLPHDAMRTARNHGMLDESKKTQNEFNLIKKPAPLTPKSGEVIIVFENGFSPYKYELHNLPFQQVRHSTINIARVKSLHTGEISQSEHVKDLTLLAKTRHEERMPEIRRKVAARETARAVVSFGAGLLAWAAVGVKTGMAVGAVTSAVMSSLTQADLRSWNTLPAQVDLARLTLSPGKHDLAIKLYGHYGTELYRGVLKDVVIRPGKRTWLIQKLP